MKRSFNSSYSGPFNTRTAFPMGGIGAGMICLEGNGSLTRVSLRHKPALLNDPIMFSAVCVQQEGQKIARVLEGPVAELKIFGERGADDAGFGLIGFHDPNLNYGLPRFTDCSFQAKFPFGNVTLTDSKLPLSAVVTGWSPFIPSHADESSLPVIGLEYTFTNHSDKPLEFVYSFHASNFMAYGDLKTAHVLKTNKGFIVNQPPADDQPWAQGAFAAVVDDPQAATDCAWFRGHDYDTLTVLWNTISSGECPDREPHAEPGTRVGGSIYVKHSLAPLESKTIWVKLSWFVPNSKEAVAVPENSTFPEKYYRPWYAGKFGDIHEVISYWNDHYQSLRDLSAQFRDHLFASSLPDEVIEAISANLTILKSPTVMRQIDGRFWGWEGIGDTFGSCHGSCTHVWNYAQAVPHLFPELERSLRYTEFNDGQNAEGRQSFRVPLPIQQAEITFHAAADGQLGGIMKFYREWRISGDDEWLRSLWPKAKQSLQYCMDAWDPKRKGILEESHHNTYDIEFLGPEGMSTSIYLGALKAASRIAQILGEPHDEYDLLYKRGRDYMENELFNGEYFEQKVVWEGLEKGVSDAERYFNVVYSPESLALIESEGPKYQYGKGCLADGVIGAWHAEMCGLGEILDPVKVRSHLLSVHKYNLKHDLTEHVNASRPGYAIGKEAGLLLCTWPRGGMPTLPFGYSREVWTGIEYQVASHLMLVGCVEEGLQIVRACRSRYDGLTRNPFDEYECGHWYARALASYALIQGLSGIRYDAIERTLYVSPRLQGDFQVFFCAEGSFGMAGVRNGQPFYEPSYGKLAIERIQYDHA